MDATGGAVPASTAISLSELGLRGRGEVFLDADAGELALLIDRKSRWLRKDAARFLEIKQAAEARVGRPLRGRVLVRNAPICSKARSWMEDEGVLVEAVS